MATADAGVQSADAVAGSTRPSGNVDTAPLADAPRRSAGERRVDAYNFRQPRIFSHDQIRLLNYVHDAFARGLSVFLSDRLRTIVEVRVDAIEQLSYAQYVSSCKKPTALFVAEEAALGHKMVFEVDPLFILFNLEKSLGGEGNAASHARHLSRIEQRFMSKILVRIMDELSSAWGEIATMKFHETNFESNAEFIQIIPGTEPVLVSRFRLIAFSTEYYFNVCYPYLMLRQAVGRTGIKQWLSRSKRDVDANIRDQYTHHLGETQVELRAELGRARLSLGDVKNLQQGDVIPLQTDSKDPINVFIADQLFFSGRIGKVGRHMAVGVSVVKNRDSNE